MRNTSVIVVALLIALVGLGAFWLTSGSDRAPEELGPVAGPDAAEDAVPGMTLGASRAPAAVDSLLPAPASERSDAAEPAADETPAVGAHEALLVVRVLHAADDRPVPDAAVRVLVAEGWAAAGDQRARTDADGRARFVHAAPFGVRTVAVAGSPEHGGALTSPRAILDAGERLDVELVVGEPARLGGVVEDEDGRPVPDAVVQAWSLSRWQLATTPGLAPDLEQPVDGAGHFELAGVGPDFVLSARAPGRAAAQRLHGRLEPGEHVDGARVVLGPAHELVVHVLDGRGEPVGGAEVRTNSGISNTGPQDATEHPDIWRMGPPDVSGRSGPDGVARLAPVAAESYTLEVERAPFVPEVAFASVPGEPVEVVLRDGAALTGVVRGADGRGLSGARLRLAVRAAERGGVLRETVSDEAGRFAFPGVPAPKSSELLVVAPGHAVEFRADVVPADGSPGHVELDLVPELRLAGVLREPDGAPLAGAELTIEGERVVPTRVRVIPTPTWERRAGLDRATTDEQGRFAFGQLYAGTFALTAEHPQHAGTTVRWELDAGASDLDLVFERRTSDLVLRGRVTDGRSGQPLPAFTVTPMLATGGGFMGSQVQVESADGRYEILDLKPGRYQVAVQADGYARVDLPPRTLDPGLHELDVELQPERELTLRVVDPRGAPRPRTALTFELESGERLSVVYGPNARTSQLTTDAEGLARARGLPAARVVVRARPPGRPVGLDEPFVFDLWDPIEGEQTLVVPDEVAPERVMDVRLSFFSCAQPGFERPPLPARIQTDADREAIAPHVASGLLQRLGAKASIMLAPSDGSPEGRSMTLEPRGDGYVVTEGGAEAAQAHGFVRVQLRKGTAWDVSVFAKGHNSWRMTIPADAGNAEYAAVLWRH